MAACLGLLLEYFFFLALQPAKLEGIVTKAYEMGLAALALVTLQRFFSAKIGNWFRRSQRTRPAPDRRPAEPVYGNVVTPKEFREGIENSLVRPLSKG